MCRVDSLITELRARHGNDEQFFEQLRPLIVKIFDHATPEKSRSSLLEMIAAACEFQLETKANCEATQLALRSYAANLNEMLRSMLDQFGLDHPE